MNNGKFSFESSNRGIIFPLLTVRGAAILSVIACLLPVLSLLGIMPVSFFLMSAGPIVLILYLLFEYIKLKKLLGNFTVVVDIPTHLRLSENELAKVQVANSPEISFQLKLHSPPSLDIELVTGAATASLLPKARGNFSIEKSTLRLLPLHGLFAWQTSTVSSAPIRFTIEPNPKGIGQANQQKNIILVGERKSQFLAVEGREFRELRPYVHGENLRKVDWKRSAKRGQLLVKHYAPETRERVMVFIDSSRRMSGTLVSENNADVTALDLACGATLGLQMLATKVGDDFGVAAFDSEERFALSPSNTSAQRRELRDYLTQITPSGNEPDYFLMTSRGLSLPRRSLLILITNLVMPSSLELLRTALMPLTKKHLVSVIALRDLDLEKLRLSSAQNISDAFIRSAAQRQVEHIEERAQWLRRTGLDCVLTEPRSLSEVAQRTYTARKRGGRW